MGRFLNGFRQVKGGGGATSILSEMVPTQARSGTALGHEGIIDAKEPQKPQLEAKIEGIPFKLQWKVTIKEKLSLP